MRAVTPWRLAARGYLPTTSRIAWMSRRLLSTHVSLPNPTLAQTSMYATLISAFSGECEVGVPRAFGIAAVLGFRIHAIPINCLQRGQPDLRLGLAPARADSITSAQPIPMPGQGRALALAGMISIARLMKDRREDRAKDREFWRQFAATAARPASLQNAFERGERRASAPAAQAPASSIRGARDIRAHDDDHPRGRGNARGRARAYGHGDAASRGDVARVGPR